MINNYLLILFTVFGFVTSGCGQSSPQTEVEKSILSAMKSYDVPSVSIAVIQNGKIAWAKAYGIADKTTKRAADTNTIYQVASMSKCLNAFCIMRLVEDGKLSLDADMRKYLHSWTFPDNELSKNTTITIRSLLSHTAGLSVHGFKGYLHTETIPSINEMLNGTAPANSGRVEAILKPGTKMEYSGGGILVTNKILQDNIAQNYDSLLEHFVLRPLGMMNSTFVQLPDEKYSNYAAAYDEKGQEIPGKYYIYPEASPDGLWATATDYARFIISVQHSLTGRQPSLLTRQTVTTMLTPVLENSALGFFITSKGTEKYFGHSGSNIGFKSVYNGSFTSGDGVVVLTNSDNGGNLAGEIVKKVASVYHWKDF